MVWQRGEAATGSETGTAGTQYAVFPQDKPAFCKNSVKALTTQTECDKIEKHAADLSAAANSFFAKEENYAYF